MFMNKYFIILSLSLLSQSAMAWPIFTVPNYEDINMAGQTSPCEQDPKQFRIKANAIIPVRSDNPWPLLGWHWTSKFASPCLSKIKPLNVSKIDISYVNDPAEFWVLYSVITAYFLAPDGSTFIMHLKTPEEHWFCILEKKLQNHITCANDI